MEARSPDLLCRLSSPFARLLDRLRRSPEDRTPQALDHEQAAEAQGRHIEERPEAE
jgi:hypothetical protein